MKMKRFILICMTLDGEASVNESLYNVGSFNAVCKKMFITKEDALNRLKEITAQDLDELREYYPEEDGYTIAIEPSQMEETELNVYYHGDVVYQTRYKIAEVYDY